MSVSYQVTDGLNAFVRNSTGYRSGGFNGEVFNNRYDEETTDQWELGVKSEWWDRRLRVNASVYQYKAEDLQRRIMANYKAGNTGNLQARWPANCKN